jgi:hypothetical protein
MTQCNNRWLAVTILIFGLSTITACQKFLEEKSDVRLTIVDEIPKAQALLDNRLDMYTRMPSMDVLSADEYYVTQSIYNGLDVYDRSIYIWSKQDIFRTSGDDWTTVFRKIYVCNVALESLDRMDRKPGDDSAWNATHANALLLRSVNFLVAAKIWCKAYDAASAKIDLGLPLRLDVDFEKPSVRSNLEETYNQIINDLKEAAKHLPVKAHHVLRPSKAAAYAFLARGYLSMRMYDSAGHYAGLSMQLQNDLYDYNTVPNPAGNGPFGPVYSHPEIIMNLETNGPPNLIHPNRSRVDTLLYELYEPNDLRKTIYFLNHADGSKRFKGSLTGSNVYFQGPTVAEMILIRSECLARRSDQDSRDQALQLLNHLLEKRYQSGTFVPVAYVNPQQLLDAILTERRKELIYRGERWSDIKRLNKEGRSIVLKRFINDEWHQLESNSPRYATPIPENVIAFSGMLQNP